MNKQEFKEMIDDMLKAWGYPAIPWQEIEADNMQDDAFISAAIVVYQAL